MFCFHRVYTIVCFYTTSVLVKHKGESVDLQFLQYLVNKGLMETKKTFVCLVKSTVMLLFLRGFMYGMNERVT